MSLDINAKIAEKVMGWTYVQHRCVEGHPLSEWMNPQMSKWWKDTPEKFLKLDSVLENRARIIKPPEYTEEVSCALEAAEEFAERNDCKFELGFMQTGSWWAVFEKVIGIGKYHIFGYAECIDTPAAAICSAIEAALAVVEAKEED